MKQTRYISAALVLLSALAVASCKNFDYEELVAAGNPVVKAATVGSAEMGDSIDVKVTCKDTGRICTPAVCSFPALHPQRKGADSLDVAERDDQGDC